MHTGISELAIIAAANEIEELFKKVREGELDPRLQYIMAIPCAAFVVDVLYDGLCVVAEKPILKCLATIIPDGTRLRYKDMGDGLISLDTENLPAPVRTALVSGFEARVRMVTGQVQRGREVHARVPKRMRKKQVKQYSGYVLKVLIS